MEQGYTLNAWAAYDVFFIAFLAAVLGGERRGKVWDVHSNWKLKK